LLWRVWRNDAVLLGMSVKSFKAQAALLFSHLDGVPGRIGESVSKRTEARLHYILTIPCYNLLKGYSNIDMISKVVRKGDYF
jgi:hypothetical protein